MDTIGNYVFDKRDLLGNGAFAIVFKGYKKQEPKQQVAVKCITKKELNKSKELLAKEICVLRELSVCKHENLVTLLDVNESESTVYLILEYCNGGDLSSYLMSKGTLSEDALSSFMQQIASALNALYAKAIMHRDIKPQNILLCLPRGGNKTTTPPTQLTFKLADFGFARFLAEGKLAATLCGSPMYMAPEVIMSQKYDCKADLWSVGTIVYQCLTGKAPFVAKDPQQLRDFYHSHLDLKPKIPENTSPELKDMLLRLLMRDPNKRMGIKELSEHPFLKKFRRSPSRRGHSSSPIPARRQTPSLSSESSSPGSNREISPLARQVGEVGDMVNTLTGSNEEDNGFTKVEKPDTRPHTPDDFVLVPESLPEYNSSGERRGKYDRAPLALAEEEYDAFDESLTSSSLHSGGGVRMHSGEGRAIYRKGDDSYQRLPSPVSPSPSPPLSQRSGGSSAPIPVPSLSRMSSAGGQREGSGTSGGSGKSGGGSPAPRAKKRSASSGSGDRSGDRLSGRRNSETALAAPDITQVSPPPVQFNIGTPPNTGTWKRTNGYGGGGSTVQLDTATTVPIMIGSPLRRSASCSPGSCFTHHTTTAANPSPTPAPTPTGFSPGSGRHCPYHHPSHPHPHLPPPQQQQQQQQYTHFYQHQHYAAHDPYAFHDAKFHRYPTVPDCTALVAYPGPGDCGLEPCHRCGTEPDLRAPPFNTNVYMRAAAFPPLHQTTTLPGLGALVPWSGSREHLTSLGVTNSSSSDKDRQSPCSLDHHHYHPHPDCQLGPSTPTTTTPLLQRRNSLMGEMPSSSSSSPLRFPTTASPTSLDVAAAVAVPPELSEDTLMDDEHNQTMARLRFILDVVDCVVTLGRSKGVACLNPMVESLTISTRDPMQSINLPPKLAQSQKLVEQLVLYLRALQMMAQSINLAEKEMRHDRLQYVNSLKKVLRQQNELYLYCVEECRKLYEQLGGVCKTKNPLTPQLIVNTADKLIYNYAVEQCQTAALDELEGNKKESFHRYTTAQILLHSLSQLARNDHDRVLLEKYRHSVELRLSNMGSRDVQRACPTWS